MPESVEDNMPLSNNYLTKVLKQYSKKTKLLVSLTALGLLLFLSIAFTFPFKDQLLARLYPKPQSKAVQTETVQSLTNQLLQGGRISPQSGQRRLQSQGVSVDALKSLAIRRKVLLIEEIKTNPQQAVSHFISQQDRAQFPPSVQEHLEKEKEVTGKVTSMHIDSSDASKNKYTYGLIENGSNKTYGLQFINQPADPKTDSRVKVKGTTIDSYLVVQDIQPEQTSGRMQILDAPAPLVVQGNQRTAVILLKTQNANPTFTKEQMEYEMFGSNGLVNSFYRQASENRVSFSGAVLGWYTITMDQADGFFNNGCGFDGMMGGITWVKRQLSDRLGVSDDLSGYDRLVTFIVSDPNYLDDAGCGQLNRKPSYTLLRIPSLSSNRGKYAILHELGHNLGVHHANFLNKCPNLTDYFESRCNKEYGDSTDVMGSGDWNSVTGGSSIPHLFNAPHRIALGWLPQASIQTVTSSGRYTISALNASSGVKVLKLARPNSLCCTGAPGVRNVPYRPFNEDYYYLSYRKRDSGFDSDFLDANINGVTVHIWSGATMLWTYLIDTTPDSISPRSIFDQYYFPDTRDAALSDSRSYFDEQNSIRITQVSHTDQSAVVDVALPAPTSTPTPTPTPSFTCTACKADITGSGDRKDNVVTILDFSRIASCFNKRRNPDGTWPVDLIRRKSCSDADINQDGVVNTIDSSCVISQFNQRC